jgi:hypothetical protein
MFKIFLQIGARKHTEAPGSNRKRADDLVLGSKNLLSPPSATALGPPVYLKNLTSQAGFEPTIQIS